jgi:hypothetical protein
VKVYASSKSKHWPFFAALRAAGVPIQASWLDAPFNHTGEEPTADHWARHWEMCCREAVDADAVLMFAQAGENQNGKQVFLVSPHDWSWAHHPRVRRFATLADAITAIQAAAMGAKLRVAR